jgi:hypothetical protein
MTTASHANPPSLRYRQGYRAGLKFARQIIKNYVKHDRTSGDDLTALLKVYGVLGDIIERDAAPAADDGEAQSGPPVEEGQA